MACSSESNNVVNQGEADTSNGECLVGSCDRCGHPVWLTPLGACPYGHPASAISKTWNSPPAATEYPAIRHCRTCGAEVYETVTACPQCGFAPTHGTAYCRACGASTLSGQVMCTQCDQDLSISDRAVAAPMSAATPGTKNRTTAGILALILGGFGAHKFYMGYTGEGLGLLIVDMIIVFATAGAGAIATMPIPVLEGIAYLRMTDEEFHQTYVLGRKGWF